jgi:hypothetical protein
VPILVVGGLEAVEIVEDQRRRGPLPPDVGHGAREFPLKAAPVEHVKQRVGLRCELEPPDLIAGGRQLRAEPFKLGDERGIPRRRWRPVCARGRFSIGKPTFGEGSGKR